VTVFLARFAPFVTVLPARFAAFVTMFPACFAPLVTASSLKPRPLDPKVAEMAKQLFDLA
jgi:hypothetical protein